MEDSLIAPRMPAQPQKHSKKFYQRVLFAIKWRFGRMRVSGRPFSASLVFLNYNFFTHLSKMFAVNFEY